MSTGDHGHVIRMLEYTKSVIYRLETVSGPHLMLYVLCLFQSINWQNSCKDGG